MLSASPLFIFINSTKGKRGTKEEEEETIMKTKILWLVSIRKEDKILKMMWDLNLSIRLSLMESLFSKKPRYKKSNSLKSPKKLHFYYQYKKIQYMISNRKKVAFQIKIRIISVTPWTAVTPQLPLIWNLKPSRSTWSTLSSVTFCINNLSKRD